MIASVQIMYKDLEDTTPMTTRSGPRQCYLNGFEEAKELLFSIQKQLRDCSNLAYQNHKDAMRILRKIKYN